MWPTANAGFGWAQLCRVWSTHVIVTTVASLLTQAKLRPDAALMPLLIAISTNTLTKSLITFQSGGWTYVRQVSGGVWLTTAAVWLGDIAESAGFGF